MVSRASKVAKSLLGVVMLAAVLGGALLYHGRPAVKIEPEVLPPPKRGLQITTSAILLDGSKVLDLSSLSEQARLGVDARFKVNGPNDLLIVPLSDAFSRRRAAPQPPVGLSVELAVETPYRVMLEVLCTATRAGASKFHLLLPVSGSAAPLTLDVEAPRQWPVGEGGAGIFVVTGGISIKFPGGNVAPGCNGVGPGLAVPKRDGYDLPAFAECFRRVNTASRPPVDRVLMVANPETPALQIVRIGNAVRCGEPSCEERRLGFPFVSLLALGVPR